MEEKIVVVINEMAEYLSISQMGLIELASNNSFWRGVDYYEKKKVTACKKMTKIPIPAL